VDQAAEDSSTSTEPPGTELPRQVRARTIRRIFVAVLATFIALGALNVYGVRTRTASASGGGYELEVRYATVSRPGLATPWSLEVRRPGGFPDGLTVAIISSYFDAFDENGLDPQPVDETNDGEWTIWTFGPSAGDTVSVSLDARIEPGVQLTRVKGQAEVRTEPSGAAVVTVAFSTFVMP
jgi:hypothetical protein